MKALKKHWWKVLSVPILFLTTYWSFTTPLQPGILSVEQVQKGGKHLFRVKGYNTHFKTDKDFAWLSNSDKSDCIKYFGNTVVSDTEVELYFNLPDTLSSQYWHLYYSNLEDGALFYPNVIIKKGSEINQSLINDADWPKAYVLKAKGMHFPFQNILYETIRNLNFHVVMWMAILGMLFFSLIFSIRYLLSSNINFDRWANALVETSLWFTVLGIVTGMIWAKNTWGAYWVNDPKLNGAVVGGLVYLAYIILRRSVKEMDKRARLSAVYNVFAFVIYIVFIQVLPRFTDSLHPGNGGNPAFSSYDLDDSLRMVFYPSIIGFLLVGFWISQLKVRLKKLDDKIEANY